MAKSWLWKLHAKPSIHMARWCPNWHMLDFHESWNCGNMITKNTCYSEVDKNIRTCNTFIVKPNSNQERHYITTIVQQTLPPFHFISCDQKNKKNNKQKHVFCTISLVLPLVFHTDMFIHSCSRKVPGHQDDERLYRGQQWLNHDAHPEWLTAAFLTVGCATPK